MFNSIYVVCQECGRRVEFQTKSGSCLLCEWDLEDAPNKEIKGIIGDDKECDCGHVIRVDEEKIILRVS